MRLNRNCFYCHEEVCHPSCPRLRSNDDPKREQSMDEFDLTDVDRVSQQPLRAAADTCNRLTMAIAIADCANRYGDIPRAQSALQRARGYADALCALLEGVL